MAGREGGRPLTRGEIEIARSLFGDAIDYDPVRVHRRKWFPFHPKRAVMAPDGHLWTHPEGALWSEDYSAERLGLQGLFAHEMTHVLQAQQRGKWYLTLMRHPFCRYAYEFIPGRPFDRYGLEQQAEIVRDIFLGRNGAVRGDGKSLALLEPLLGEKIRSGRG